MYRDWGRQSDIPRRTNGKKWPNLPEDQDARFIYEKIGYNLGPLELQAAMGLSVLPHMAQILEGRKKVVDYYNEQLNHSNLQTLKIREGTEWNYSYYPVIFESEERLLQMQKKMNENNIYPRRYFYPSLNTINYLNETEMPISESVAKRVLCLPLYSSLERIEYERISSLIL
jgi:dTDP-4-amino-4,6-dideoxygalactose transaminase